jgi:acyl-CoA thioesterase YciA
MPQPPDQPANNGASLPVVPPTLRVVMMPKDANPYGTIHGGAILSLIDEAAYVEALRQAEHRYAAVALDNVRITAPLSPGDLVEVYAQTQRIGRTSITIAERIIAFPHGQPSQPVEVATAQIVLVALNDQHEPVPILEPPPP